MSEELLLIEPAIDYKDEYIQLLDEWTSTEEKLVPFVLRLDPSDFEAMIHELKGYSQGVNIPQGFVPHSTYWLVNRERKILGVVNIRHKLNDRLLVIGGHIGYGIRPSQRRNGYATKILQLALKKAKELEIDRVLVTCDKNNIGSAKTILNNGGILESESEEENGNIVQRYRILNTEKILFWDFDGTLGYRHGGMWGASMLEALKEYDPDSNLTAPDFRPFLITGFPWHSPDTPHPHIQSADERWTPIIQKFYQGYVHFGYSHKQSMEMAHRAKEIFLDVDRWALFDDSMETLEELTLKGWKHIIVSNHVPELKRIIDHIGLAASIDFVVNSAETGYEKPHPQIYEYALKKVIQPNKVWMIGDNIDADVLGAEAIGLKGILVRNQDSRARYQSEDLKGVIKIIESHE